MSLRSLGGGGKPAGSSKIVGCRWWRPRDPVIEPRVYRAALVPAILAFLLAMFSLESQPPPAEIDLAADILFQGDSAAATAERIARRHPDRGPGTPGNEAVAELVATGFEQRGFEVDVDEFDAEGRDLSNVVGTRDRDRTGAHRGGRRP